MLLNNLKFIFFIDLGLINVTQKLLAIKLADLRIRIYEKRELWKEVTIAMILL